MPTSSTADVLLVFPGRYRAPDPQVPLQLLHVAAALRPAGYRPRIYDMRLHDYRSLDLGEPLFVGHHRHERAADPLRPGVRATRARRTPARAPSCGAASTPRCCPSRPPASACVDVVVRGECELSVGPLADAPGRRRPLARRARHHLPGGRRGLQHARRRAHRPRRHPRGAALRPAASSTLPHAAGGARAHADQPRLPAPLRLLLQHRLQRPPLARQEPRARRRRDGSPCCGAFRHARSSIPSTTTSSSTASAPKRSATTSWSRGIKVAWRANCRFDYLAKYDGDFVQLVERAGCMELDFGGESGSAAMQDFVCKDVSAGEILTSVANLARWAPSIDPFVSWLSGLPGETYDDMDRDLRPDGRHGPRQPAHPALRHLPVHAVPQPAARLAAARVPPAAVARGVGRDRGLPLRAALAHAAYVEKLRTSRR